MKIYEAVGKGIVAYSAPALESGALAHFAFVTDTIDAVVTRLTDAGFPVTKDGADEPYRRNIYFVDPNGFEVEFVQYLSDIPEQRNLSS